IPGSPPIKTSVPGTMPPPRTRSNSVTPEGMRTSSCDSISVNAMAEMSRCEKPVRRAGCAFSSTSEFHSPHSGHLPNHFPDLCPQFWQTNKVSFFNQWILQQLFHILSRAAEHRAIAAFDDGSLQ